MSITSNEKRNALFQDYPDVVSVSELSQMLHICKKTAYKLIKDNEIGYFKIGCTYKIPKSSILTYISGENLCHN